MSSGSDLVHHAERPQRDRDPRPPRQPADRESDSVPAVGGTAGRPLWVSECALPVKWAGDPALQEPTEADSRILAERVLKTFVCSLHEGSAATFYLLLPHYVEGQTQFGILRLVVDDTEFMVQVLVDIFTAEGFTVHAARSGPEALADFTNDQAGWVWPWAVGVVAVRHLGGRDFRALWGEFGRDLTFHGGIDMQRLLPHGTPKQVRAEVRVLAPVSVGRASSSPRAIACSTCSALGPGPPGSSWKS